ncbi:UvrD/REP helicase [Dethiosulfovibrio peptidovorans DSM 11002]|uniref:DNA 3'-5' helicase n=2 Tax=Dethiosulfovibrio TaxID=47054 RepID=D2Z4S0_9BACT|nr:UvrD/REP helicase [Dethiosulfovibrio peptidovorans DSM 11002]
MVPDPPGLARGEKERMTKDSPVLESLNPRQREAVSYEGTPLLVLAGAGSGKTRVLTSKLAWLVAERSVPPWRILAVTFTNKAAREMKDRVDAMLDGGYPYGQISTFHSFGLQMLFRNRDALEARGYRRNFVVFDRGDSLSLVKKSMKAMKLDTSQMEPSWVLECISKAKTGSDPVSMDGAILEGDMAELYSLYTKSLKEQGAFDFDDLIVMPLHLMSTDRDILKKERDRLDWILVDEYQDVNRPQFALLRLLAGDSPNVMAVGDPDQSIYGWRGADMSVILGFERHFPGSKVILLEQNYRSTETILDAANSVIGNNVNRPEKRLWTARSGGEPINVVTLGDERAEARYVSDVVEELLSLGYRYTDMAVLYRMNALSRNFEQEFVKRGLPYRVVKGTAFYDRKEIKDAISYLRLAVNPRDASALARVANVPPRGLGAKGLESVESYLSTHASEARTTWCRIADGGCGLRGKGDKGIRDLARHMISLIDIGSDLNRAVEYIMDVIGYGSYLEKGYPDQFEERRENVMELTSISPGSESLEDVLAEIALYTDQEVDDIPDGISLSSLHAAKGLEFPVVFIVGMEDGIFPHGRSLDGGRDELEEERRLCYVGMTRAEERLYLTSSRFRRLFGSVMNNDVSRFIWEIPENYRVVESRAGEGPNHVRFGNYRGYRRR